MNSAHTNEKVHCVIKSLTFNGKKSLFKTRTIVLIIMKLIELVEKFTIICSDL